MTRIKKFLVGLGRTGRVIVASTFVLFVAAGIAQAATTISTNIQTDGTLSVTGVSTFVNASTTQSASVAGPLWVGGNATTTGAGALTINGAFSGTSGTFSTTLGVTGLTTLANASTTGVMTVGGPLWVGGNATTTAAGALTINGAFSGTSGTFSTTLGVTNLSTLTGGYVSQASSTVVGTLGASSLLLLSGDTIKNASASSTALSGNLTVGGGTGSATLTVTNTANATSTATAGCIVTTATSSATSIRLMFNNQATTTTLNGNTVQGVVLWGYGSSCAN